MNRLLAQWHRLYLCDAPTLPQDLPAEPWLAPDEALTADAPTRLVVLELARPADWSLMGAVWQGVQTDLELPAPAIAVNGTDGYQLWFSLAEAVAPAQARAFLQGLVVRYLAKLPPRRLCCWPTWVGTGGGPVGGTATLRVPAEHSAGERWSAFVAPDLARIFADDPWLDLAPNPASQAELLAGIKSIQPNQWAAALALLAPFSASSAPPAAPPTSPLAPASAAEVAPSTLDNAPPDPEGFLLAVMNNPQVALALRIEAAKALLVASTPSAHEKF